MNSIFPTILLGAIALGSYAVAFWKVLAVFIPRHRGTWGLLSSKGHIPLGALSCVGFALAFAGMAFYITALLVNLANRSLTMVATTSFIVGWGWVMFIGPSYDHYRSRRKSIEMGALSRPTPLVETATRQHDDTHKKRAS